MKTSIKAKVKKSDDQKNKYEQIDSIDSTHIIYKSEKIGSKEESDFLRILTVTFLLFLAHARWL